MSRSSDSSAPSGASAAAAGANTAHTGLPRRGAAPEGEAATRILTQKFGMRLGKRDEDSERD